MNKVNTLDLEKLSTEELQNLLYKELVQEYDEFIEDLKKLPPKEIIENSYKKVMFEDIVSSFEREVSYLNKKQLIALLKFKCPLYMCYEAWMDTDYSHMEMLRDSIIEYINIDIEYTDAA